MAPGKIRQHVRRLRVRALSILGLRKTRARVVTLGAGKIITEGLENNVWTDFYHNAMTVTWPAFFGSLAAIFILFNLLFAQIYNFGEAPIANAKPGSFSDLFFFSVETTSTVGYGDMHPQSMYGHLVATVENFFGLVSLAVMTGLVFARFSRPRARLIFASNPVVAVHNGAPTLMVRLANARNNFISDASAKLWVTLGISSAEGRRSVSFQPLRLERSENPVFALSWTLFHVIDANSPLDGMSAGDIGKSEMNFVVTINGLDETSSQLVHARKRYAAADLRVGHEFVDIIRIDEEGMRHVDYAKIHDTRPVVA
ncbi:ion channel [Methylocapsa sp. S129]|uniref:ion channel n=1 Tax=Methylocapsa sp. S129 TaxID=1641869 RepID=UPI00131D2D48|nr:ion channel [Methylocapsa sp. S129]